MESFLVKKPPHYSHLVIMDNSFYFTFLEMSPGGDYTLMFSRLRGEQKQDSDKSNIDKKIPQMPQIANLLLDHHGGLDLHWIHYRDD